MAKSRVKKKKAHKTSANIRNEKEIRPSITIERPDINSRVQWTIVPEFPPNDYRAQTVRLPEESPSIYEVTFVFAVPGKDVFKDKLDIIQLMKSGDSLLQVAPGVSFIKLSISTDKTSVGNGKEDTQILFLTNSNHRISGARMRIDALNFLDAEKIAYDLIMPQISYWAFVYNISMDLFGYEILEEKTQSKKYNFGILGKVKPFGFSDEIVASTPKYRKFYAAYREGMNAVNVFYQALCFYKVAEGISAERKREQRQKKNDTPTYLNETIPTNLDEPAIIDESVKFLFKPYAGQSFVLILENLKELVRNAIAHLSNLDGILDPDKFEDVNVCSSAVPILHYIARRMLQNQTQSEL